MGGVVFFSVTVGGVTCNRPPTLVTQIEMILPCLTAKLFIAALGSYLDDCEGDLLVC